MHGFLGQLPPQRGELVAQVGRDHEVPVPRQLPRGALGGPTDRLGVLVLQGLHGGLAGEDVHHHQAVPGRIWRPGTDLITTCFSRWVVARNVALVSMGDPSANVSLREGSPKSYRLV